MNIFIVETPMELVSAIEARHYFPQEESILFIHSFYPKKVFMSLIDRDKWHGKIIFYRDKAVNWSDPRQTIMEKFRLRMTLEKIICEAGEANYLFINYFRAHMRHVINHLKHQNLILIEGGTDALSTNALRYIPKTEITEEKKISWFRFIKRYLWKKYIELDTEEVPSVTFFSAYDLDVRRGDRLIKNDYRHIKQWVGNLRKGNEIYFLGQPLSEDGYMECERFYAYLGEINKYIGKENIIFLPHPRQSERVVNELVKRYGFRIRRFNLPIEIELLLGKECPKMLIGFWSSALQNCYTLFGEELEIEAFYIEPRDLLIKHQYVQDVYRYMQKETCRSFEVVRLSGGSW